MGPLCLLLALAEHSSGHGEGWEKSLPCLDPITPPAVTCVPRLLSILSRNGAHPTD